jgi:thioredoxin 1
LRRPGVGILSGISRPNHQPPWIKIKTGSHERGGLVMSKIIENESYLENILSECSSLLVLFYASWCPYSQRFLPTFEKHAENNEKNFCRVLTDEIKTCKENYSIAVVPTVIFFKNGKIAKRLDGIIGKGLNENQLVEMIDSLK